jgi:uncharacterized Zn finger protein
MKWNRFEAVQEKAAELMMDGHIVFSPIAYSHQFHVDHKMPGDWQFWQRYDSAFLEWCDEMWILMLPGWQESRGIQAEISIAASMGKSIRYLEA